MLNISTDVESRSEPAFMVIAGNVVCVDALPRGVVVREILCLAVNGGRQDRLAIDTSDVAVNGITRMKDCGYAFGLKQVILLM
jgi:ribosomal protein S4E